MAHKVVFTARALRDLERLDDTTQRRIADKLREYAKEPLRYARKLTNPTIGSYRYRAGEYRVVFDLAGEEIVILRLGARKDIYK